MKTFALATLATVAGLTAAAPAPLSIASTPETKGWLVFNIESATNPEYTNQTVIIPRNGSSVPLEIAPRNPQGGNQIFGQLRGPNPGKNLYLQEEVSPSTTRYEARVEGSAYSGLLSVNAAISSPEVSEAYATFGFQAEPGSTTFGELIYLPRSTFFPPPDHSFLACDTGRNTLLQFGAPGVYGQNSDVKCSAITIKAQDLFISPPPQQP